MVELKLNGYDHVRIEEAQLSGGAAREEDVREFFGGFPVDRVRCYVLDFAYSQTNSDDFVRYCTTMKDGSSPSSPLMQRNVRHAFFLSVSAC